MVYFYSICNIIFKREFLTLSSIVTDETIKSENDIYLFIESSEKVIGILLSIVTGVSIILGCLYIKSIKEKANSATFTFWSHLKVKIIKINNLLKAEPGLINNMYPPETRMSWEDVPISNEKVKDFSKLINETLKYLEETPDQMPAYRGWSNDLYVFLEFLTNAIQYDIADSETKFSNCFSEATLTDRNAYVKKISHSMDKLINGINKRQEKIEKKLYH